MEKLFVLLSAEKLLLLLGIEEEEAAQFLLDNDLEQADFLDYALDDLRAGVCIDLLKK